MALDSQGDGGRSNSSHIPWALPGSIYTGPPEQVIVDRVLTTSFIAARPAASGIA